MSDEVNRAGNGQAIDRRNLLLGTSTLVAAATLTSEVLVQAQKAAPAAAPAAAQPAAASDRKPNILVIFGDDIGIPQISAYTMGMMGYRTPNIDRIAREGAIFTDAYGQQSCTAGRASVEGVVADRTTTERGSKAQQEQGRERTCQLP